MDIHSPQKLKFTVVQDERFIDLNLYQFGWEKCESLHSYGPYIRNHYLFHFVLSGNGQLTNPHGVWPISPGSGFLISPGEITTYIADQADPWEYAWIEMDGLIVPNAMQQAGLSPQHPVYTPHRREDSDRLGHQLMTIVDHGNDPSMFLLGNGFLFLDLLIRGMGSAPQSNARRIRDFYMKEAISFIEQNYQRNISVEDIADFCGLNRSYFGRVFKEAMGESPQRFLIIYRMAKAARFLSETLLPVQQISQEVGYENPLHFSRAFKEIYGISPRTYRQKHYQT